MFSPFDLPSGILLLVTDQLASPADFVLHRGLIDHLKVTNLQDSKKAIVLSVSQDLTRWTAIAAKSNLHLDQKITSGAFIFVDVLERARPRDTDSSGPILRPILDTVTSVLEQNNGSDVLVIVDDLATLDWIGFSVLDITRFCRALATACRKVCLIFFPVHSGDSKSTSIKANATLLIRQHVLTPSTAEPMLDDLFRALNQICTYHMEVLPLASGRSGAVSGQVALHGGPGTPRGGVKLLGRRSALQYRLTDTGAVFFERGTGAGVL
ncbi:hypothetical protein MSAN_00703900 [Mycena sanguinolenta]|uniref:Elongator complex protein 5 n=1 Tax=Mycena sanguinolenta TaxID=230812 RepID=A0A8H7DF38_9AGAR|nr:hypothetical protein MSAN_00703900 [Mycena sanguinolenta]